MRFVRALQPLLVAAGVVAVSSSAFAQSPEAMRRAVDARALLPSASAPDLVVAPAASGAGLTRSERRDAALKARQEGALRPAGEGAELRGETGTGTVAARAAKGRPAAADERPAPSVLVAAAPSVATESASAPRVQKKKATKTVVARAPASPRKVANPASAASGR